MPSGGKREGAGRRSKGRRPKRKINITIDADVLTAIDHVSDNRSQWLEDVAKTHLATEQADQGTDQ